MEMHPSAPMTEGWPDTIDGGGGCIEGDSGLGIESWGGLK